MRGTTAGDCVLVTELGSGAMGTVWRAQAPDGTPRAVKVVHPHLLGRPGFRERFLREAEIGLAVRSDNVVRALALTEIATDSGPVPAIVLEYVEGRTLAEIVREQGRVPEGLCRHVGREIARGLAAVHAARVVHRDLKPGNVMLTTDHRVRLMDLGLARHAGGEDRLSQSGLFVGTAAYAPPEQFHGRRDLDPRSDLYSVGAVLFELATGRPPFDGESIGDLVRKVLRDPPPRPGALAPQMSPFLEELILTLLAKRPEHRFGSAADLGRVLEDGEPGDWWTAASARARGGSGRPLRRVRTTHETGLWGRDEEVHELRGLWEGAREGRGAVALLDGEPGIGKTRLVEELLAEADAADALAIEIRATPDADAAAALAAALRDHVAPELLAADLEQRVDTTPEFAAAFAALLRGDPSDGPARLPADATHELFARLLGALAAERPIVICVDDLHAAGPEALGLFAAIARGAAGHALLVVGTSRPGLPPRWTRMVLAAPHALHREIRRIDPAAVRTALTRQLGDGIDAQDLAERIASRTGGNPYFVVELLRHLRETGRITRAASGEFRISAVASNLDVPGSVREVVSARLAALDARDQDILRAAACQGIEFDGRLAAETLGLPALDVLRRLGRIEHASSLVRAVGAKFAFDHALVHETVLGSIGAPAKRAIHAALAAAIETRTGAAGRETDDIAPDVCATLAEHYLHGAKLDAALRYVRRAMIGLGTKGHGARRAAAIGHLALSVPDGLTPSARLSVLLMTAAASEDVGADAGMDLLDEAEPLATSLGDVGCVAKVEIRRAWSLHRTGRFDAALAAADRALARLDECPAAPSVDRIAAHNNRAIALTALRRTVEARAEIDRALALCDATPGSASEAVRLHANLGGLLDTAGDVEGAVAAHRRTIELARATGNPFEEVIAVHNMGNTRLHEARFDEARIHLQAALDMARRIGFRRAEMVAAGNLGNAFRALGRLGLAAASHRRHLALSREIAYDRGAAFAVTNLAVCAIAWGDFDAAAAHVAELRAIAERIGPAPAEGLRAMLAGACELAAGRPHDAVRTLASAQEPLVAGGLASEWTRVRLHLANALHEVGRTDEAARHLRDVRTDDRASPAVRIEAAGRLVAGVGAVPDAERAASAGVARSELAHDGAAIGLIEELGVRLDLWSYDHRPEDLARANELAASLVEHLPAELRDRADRVPLVARLRTLA